MYGGSSKTTVERVDGKVFITKTYEDGSTFTWVHNPIFEGPLPDYWEKQLKWKKKFTFPQERRTIWRRFWDWWHGIRD